MKAEVWHLVDPGTRSHMMTIVDTLVCEWKTPGEKKHAHTLIFLQKIYRIADFILDRLQ